MSTHPNTLHRAFVLAAALAALATTGARAQGPSSTSVGAGATLTIPLEINYVQNMDFGELVKTAAHDSGEVIVTLDVDLANGTITSGDPTKVVDADPGDHFEGQVGFTGDPSKTVVINFTPSITLEKAGATVDQQRMSLDLNRSLLVDFGPGFPAEIEPSAPGTYPMQPGGRALFEFGGDLHVKFDNESGAYSGTVPVSLNYL